MRLLFILLLLPFLSFGQATEADNQTIIDNIGSPLTPARVKQALTSLNTSKVSIVGTYTATGTDSYSVTVGTGITNNDAGKQILVKFTNANTSSTVSLNVNGIGALPLKTNLNANPDVGGIPAGSIFLIASTGTTWRMVGPTNAGGTAATDWGDIPTGNLNDQTDLYDTLNTKARKIYKIKPVATNYTAALGDHDNKLLIINGGSTFTVPKDADVNFNVGSALLAGDTLSSATFTKDAAVHIDTIDLHAYIKVGANKWVTQRNAGGGITTLTDGSGTTASGSAADLGGTQTDDVVIDGDGHGFAITNEESVTISAGGSTISMDDSSTPDLTINSTNLEIIAADGSSATFNADLGFVSGDDMTFTAADDMTLTATGSLVFDNTVTGSGTTGDRTINKTSGTVNFAASASTLTVTNSHCTTSSIVFAVVRTNDSTAIIKNVVPGSGSFVIRLNAAATAETSVGWWIIN